MAAGAWETHGPPMAEPDPSAYSTSEWVELKSLSRAGLRPTPGWFFSKVKSSRPVSPKSYERSYKKKLSL